MSYNKDFSCFSILPYVDSDTFISVIGRIATTSVGSKISHGDEFEKYYNRSFRKYHEAAGVIVSMDDLRNSVHREVPSGKCSELIKKECGSSDFCKHCIVGKDPNYKMNLLAMEYQFVYRITHSSPTHPELLTEISPNDFNCPVTVCIIWKGKDGNSRYEIKSTSIITRLLNDYKRIGEQTLAKNASMPDTLFDTNYTMEDLFQKIDKIKNIGKSYSEEFKNFYIAAMKQYISELFTLYSGLDYGLSLDENDLKDIVKKHQMLCSQKHYVVVLYDKEAEKPKPVIRTDKETVHPKAQKQAGKVVQESLFDAGEDDKVQTESSDEAVETESSVEGSFNLDDAYYDQLADEEAARDCEEIFDEVQGTETMGDGSQSIPNSEETPSEIHDDGLLKSSDYFCFNQYITRRVASKFSCVVTTTYDTFELYEAMDEACSLSVECVAFKQRSGKITPALIVRPYTAIKTYLLTSREIIQTFVERVVGNNSYTIFTLDAVNLSWLFTAAGGRRFLNIYSLSAEYQMVQNSMDWLSPEYILRLTNQSVSEDPLTNIFNALGSYQIASDLIVSKNSVIRPYTYMRVFIAWELLLGKSRFFLSRYENGGLKYQRGRYNEVPYKMQQLAIYNHKKGVILRVAIDFDEDSEQQMADIKKSVIDIYTIGKISQNKLLRRCGLHIMSFEQHNYLFFIETGERKVVVEAKAKIAEIIRDCYHEMNLKIYSIEFRSDRYDR